MLLFLDACLITQETKAQQDSLIYSSLEVHVVQSAVRDITETGYNQRTNGPVNAHPRSAAYTCTKKHVLI